ncbi:MAG: hypothetical protein KatS3mg111_2333 [Pirellulaceae bacterium]|nr:MAG: hypothetical protein KatS3mg111_2333 [Pirellulaceae bacterium]
MHCTDGLSRPPCCPPWVPALAIGLLVGLLGCRARVGMYVLHPPRFPHAAAQRLAIAPIGGASPLVPQVEEQLLHQRPWQRADAIVLTADRLTEAAPVRLASTSALQHDAMIVAAARRLQADAILDGEILVDTFTHPESEVDAPTSSVPRWPISRWGRPGDGKNAGKITIAWRWIDPQTGKTFDTYVLSIDDHQILAEYPDLVAVEVPEQRMAIAIARESWKLVGPWVGRETVQLATFPVLPGHRWVLAGNRAASRGDWPRARQYWEKALKLFPGNAAAHHNLALAQVAAERFDLAVEHLDRIGWWNHWGLPRETKFWIQKKHMDYQRICRGTPVGTNPAESAAAPAGN